MFTGARLPKKNKKTKSKQGKCGFIKGRRDKLKQERFQRREAHCCPAWVHFDESFGVNGWELGLFLLKLVVFELIKSQASKES